MQEAEPEPEEKQGRELDSEEKLKREQKATFEVSLKSFFFSVELNHLQTVASKVGTFPDVESAYVIPIASATTIASSSTASGTQTQSDSTLASSPSSSSPSKGNFLRNSLFLRKK